MGILPGLSSPLRPQHQSRAHGRSIPDRYWMTDDQASVFPSAKESLSPTPLTLILSVKAHLVIKCFAAPWAFWVYLYLNMYQVPFQLLIYLAVSLTRGNPFWPWSGSSLSLCPLHLRQWLAHIRHPANIGLKNKYSWFINSLPLTHVPKCDIYLRDGDPRSCLSKRDGLFLTCLKKKPIVFLS